jgi:hypothetical protein
MLRPLFFYAHGLTLENFCRPHGEGMSVWRRFFLGYVRTSFPFDEFHFGNVHTYVMSLSVRVFVKVEIGYSR